MKELKWFSNSWLQLLTKHQGILGCVWIVGGASLGRRQCDDQKEENGRLESQILFKNKIMNILISLEYKYFASWQLVKITLDDHNKKQITDWLILT